MCFAIIRSIVVSVTTTAIELVIAVVRAIIAAIEFID